jgi:hypothetical protein
MTFSPGLQPWGTREFVSFWKQFYNFTKYPLKLYEDNLNLKTLTGTNVLELLAWKLGYGSCPLEGRIRSVTVWAPIISNNLTWLNELKTREFDDTYLDSDITRSQEMVSVINRRLVMAVFLLHVARPVDYPMVDQHVLRAWHFVSNCVILDPEENLESYKTYRKFFFDFCDRSQSPPREVDQALMVFGQFLQRYCGQSKRN